LDLLDFKFVSHPAGGGTVLVPFGFWRGDWDAANPPNALQVYDREGRDVVYDGGSPMYYGDTDDLDDAQFVGWSYWESDDTVDDDAECINLIVLAPDYDEADYH
jgi:hypothetical protein